MITIATGIIQDEDNVGLVGNHAYGVLEIVECEGHRLLLVKNPWGHFRWRGKFAYGDANWTPSLKKALGYDNFSQDKGVFWINFESVMQWFSHLDMNWNPDLLKYRKSFFDYWSASDMQHTGTLSIKENPQYFINFSGAQNSTIGQIIAWVAITKLLVIHKDGSFEDEEKSSDYMAMHVFNNPTKGTKVLEDKNCHKRSVYSPEQTIMLYLSLEKAQYFNVGKVLNLVLDQHKRQKDLYYNI
jgi:calpain-7